MSEERVAEVSVRLDLEGGALAGFADELEVSLDCPVCLGCGRSSRQSTQNNIVRPWSCRCPVLYTEVEEMPRLSGGGA